MLSLESLILRHFFEVQGFMVRQCLPTNPSGIESLQIVHPDAPKAQKLPPILFSTDIPKISKALVWIPSWQAQKITPAMLKDSQELMKFIDKRLAQRKMPADFDLSDAPKIVVVPATPKEAGAREQTINLLKARNIDAMISFRSILLDLIARLDVRKQTEGLQLLQILNNFDLLKTTQMELFSSNHERRK